MYETANSHVQAGRPSVLSNENRHYGDTVDKGSRRKEKELCRLLCEASQWKDGSGTMVEPKTTDERRRRRFEKKMYVIPSLREDSIDHSPLVYEPESTAERPDPCPQKPSERYDVE